MGISRAAWLTPGVRPAELSWFEEVVADAYDSGELVLVFSFFLDVFELIADESGDSVIGGPVSPRY
ncbi:hypothetical protein [Corynebacterium sp. CCM 9204]|uniref:hypothetical protein n=1 Tax=Corynebacterium sp. CCM 9204 TaxID=3057616 RepID=UPI00352672E1